jgi:hypothetical protein
MWGMWHAWEITETCTRFWCESPKIKPGLGELTFKDNKNQEIDVRRRIHIVIFYVILKSAANMIYFVRTIQRQFLYEVSPTSLIDVSAGNYQRAVVDRSVLIVNQMQ